MGYRSYVYSSFDLEEYDKWLRRVPAYNYLPFLEWLDLPIMERWNM